MATGFSERESEQILRGSEHIMRAMSEAATKEMERLGFDKVHGMVPALAHLVAAKGMVYALEDAARAFSRKNNAEDVDRIVRYADAVFKVATGQMTTEEVTNAILKPDDILGGSK